VDVRTAKSGLGNDPTARILKLSKAVVVRPDGRGLGNDPTARILKHHSSGRPAYH